MFRQTHRQIRPACVPNKIQYWKCQQPHPQAQQQSRPLQNGGYKLILSGREHFWKWIKQAAFSWLIFAWTIAVSTCSSPSPRVSSPGTAGSRARPHLDPAAQTLAALAQLRCSDRSGLQHGHEKRLCSSLFLAWSGTEVLQSLNPEGISTSCYWDSLNLKRGVKRQQDPAVSRVCSSLPPVRRTRELFKAVITDNYRAEQHNESQSFLFSLLYQPLATAL